ncbi:MAG: IS110 family transposase, partial [Candidatus Methylomirabilales bacterium]
MEEDTAVVVGLDLGDRRSHLHAVAREGRRVVRRQSVATDREGLAEGLRGMPRCRVVLETGTHTPWVAAHLAVLGHEPLVVNARDLAFIYRSTRKDDRVDARKLAMLGLMEPPLLRPVQSRPLSVYEDLALVRQRVSLVRARTQLVNAARGMAKTMGDRVPKCCAESFARRAEQGLEDPVRVALAPLIAGVHDLSTHIKACELRIRDLCLTRYPQTRHLRQVPGVGPILALAFVLTVGDPDRFPKSRDVAPYFGLVPRRAQSGDSDPELPITKSGDNLVRWLLVQAAQHYL